MRSATVAGTPPTTQPREALFANTISVGEYAQQATPLLNQMIEESQEILPVTGSNV